MYSTAAMLLYYYKGLYAIGDDNFISKNGINTKNEGVFVVGGSSIVGVVSLAVSC